MCLEKRYETGNRVPQTIESAKRKNKSNSITNTNTEQKAITCFTIDAILNKTDDKKNFNSDKWDESVFAAKKSALQQDDEFQTEIKSDILINNTEILQFHKVPYSSIGTPYYEDDCKPVQSLHQRQTSSRDSGVSLDCDVGSPTNSHSLWIPPCTTPFYPLYPFPFVDVSSATGVTPFCNLLPTTGLTGYFNMPPTSTSFTCCGSSKRSLPSPFGYLMFDSHNLKFK